MDDNVIMPLPYKAPSEELFTLLERLAAADREMMRVYVFEYQHEELRALSELTSTQVDTLLTLGSGHENGMGKQAEHEEPKNGDF
jgi:hypothetical protein